MPVSRRAALTGAAALAPAAVVGQCAAPVHAAAPNPDEELLRLAAEHHELERQFAASSAISGELHSTSARYKEMAAQEHALGWRIRDLETAMWEHPAPVTVAGFKALASAARTKMADGFGPDARLLDGDNELSWKLVQAVLAMPA